MTHKHREFAALEPPDGVPYIDISQIQWQYYSNFHDGPLSGMVWTITDDVLLWAECFDECDPVTEDGIEDHPCGFYRRYTLTRLAPESAAAEAEHHRMFQEHVGTHWDFDEDGRPRLGRREALKPQSEHHVFYDRYADKPVRHDGTIVGWFQL